MPEPADHHVRRVVLAGSWRSGTTLARRELLRLEGVVSPIEQHLLHLAGPWLAERGRGPRYPASVLADIVDRYVSSWRVRDHLDPAPLHDWLATAPSHHVLDLHWRVVAQLAGIDGHGAAGPRGPVLIEKTPEHLWWWPVLVADPTTRFLLVTRDPRAVAEAVVRHDWLTITTLAGAMWREEQVELARLEAAAPGRCLRLPFERLVGDPDGWLREAAAFLGLESPDERRPDRARSDADDLAGNIGDGPNALAGPEGRAVHARTLGAIDRSVVDEWRSRLRPRQQRRVELTTVPQAARSGYRPEHRLRTADRGDLQAAAASRLAAAGWAATVRGMAETVAGAAPPPPNRRAARGVARRLGRVGSAAALRDELDALLGEGIQPPVAPDI